MKYLKYLLFVLLITLLSAKSAFAERKQKILVLHSYHQGLEWADNVSMGIEDIFAPLRSSYEIYYEYLDSKRNAGSDYLQQSASFINIKNSSETYEIVIAVDNNALMLLNNHQIQFAGNPPVVFCGINNFDQSLIQNMDQVTGVVETTDHIATLNTMLKLHPDRPNVTVILDKTPTGIQIRKEFKPIADQYKNTLRFNFMSDFLLKDIPDLVGKLGDDDLIYILTFNRDSKNNFISYTEGIELIVESTDVPIYGSWDFYLDKGIVGGKITAGFLQGTTVGEQALQILQGVAANDIEIMLDGPNQFMFDYRYLNKHNINLNLLPAKSVVINKPLSFFEQYQSILLNLFITLFILVIGFLYRVKRKESSMRANYAANMEIRVQERTLELESANKRLEQLSNIDGLTQLFNRRYFDSVLSQELEKHDSNLKPLALMICDIDHFKRYNDSYGHLAGDDCIRLVTTVLLKHCQDKSLTVARYGGEEFAVIMPNTSIQEALAKAEAIRIDISNMKIAHISSEVSDYVSISMGVTSIIPSHATTIESIIGAADTALYESKNNGRNRTTIKSG